MKSMRKGLAALLAMVMALGMAGCNFNDTTWVYSYAGDAMPAGVYIHYMTGSFYDAYTRLLEIENEKMEAADEDEELEYDFNDYYAIAYAETADTLLAMELDGVPVSEWMIRRTEDYVRQYYAAKELFAQYGLALDADSLASIQSLASATVSSNADYYERNGIAESSVYLQLETEQMKQDLFEHIYGEGGENAVSESELLEAIEDKYAKAQWLTYYKEDAEDEDAGAQEDTAKIQAEYAVEQLEAGETIETIYFDRAFEEAMSDGEGGTLYQPAEGDLDYIVTKDYTYSTYEYEMTGNYVSVPSVISEDVFDLEVGRAALLEDDSAYYVVRRLDITAGDEYENLHYAALRELKYDEFEEMLEAYGAGLSLTVNEASVKRYDVKFLSLD